MRVFDIPIYYREWLQDGYSLLTVVLYHIKCTRQSTGETWLAYGGGIYKWPKEQPS